MVDYQLSKAALADLERIYEYGILKFGLVQADTYYDGLVAYLQTITESPYSYVSVDEIKEGYRRAVWHSDSIYYRIEMDPIVIIRILGRQDPSRALR